MTELPARRLLTLLFLSGCATDALGPVGLDESGAAKAPSGEYCDGEDNDADGSIDEGCGQCDYLVTRVRSWWQDAECVVEGSGTGRSLYPITVGASNNYYSWDTLGSFLAAPVVTDKGRLGQQLVVARLNEKAFGIGDIGYHDWDADGDLETVSELLDLADDIFDGFDTTAQVNMFTVVVALNSEGNALGSFIDQHCARDAEYCDGLDNDGNGTVDDNCGCVEVCDGYDNNFDGQVDETGADNDRDGYTCDDCDDTRSRTNPAAYDVPENGIDDNCDGSDPEYTYDYDTNIQPIWDSYCVGCHNSSYAEAGLDLSAPGSYDRIVGVASTQLPSYNLVQPANTSLSYLYRKVQGNHTAVGGSGARMPYGGPYLNFATSGTIATWITEGAPPSCPDNDLDGWDCTDCNDADPTVFPGAPEVRGDEIDQDCDDADDLFTYGLEEDIQPLYDTYCVSCHGSSTAYLGLRLDAGYSQDETVNVPAVQLPSMDLIEPGDHTLSYMYHKVAGSHLTVGGSGNRMPRGGAAWLPEILEKYATWIDEGAPERACNDSDGDVYSCSDCDDEDASIFPGAAEIAGDGIDQDCDGVDAAAPDNDGDGADSFDDCDDTNPTVYPGATELYNGVDDDCDGTVDDGTPGYDDDGDGMTEVAGDCDDSSPTVYAGAPEINDDGIDQDCDGKDGVTVTDADSDTYPPPADCDDSNPAINPGAVELVNSIDDNCNLLIDDGTVAYDDDMDTFSELAGDCNDADPGISPTAYDVPGDGIDQDCNGSDASSVLNVGDLLDGDLVVTEVMRNPNIVSDATGEWFEVYNASGADVELSGLLVYDVDSGGATATSFTVTSSVVVAPGEYVVLGANGDTLVNGGVTEQFVYGTAFALGNGADEIYLSNGTLLVDSVVWDAGTEWVAPNGASITLDVDDLDAASNDVGANWCASVTAFGAGDFGTPGTVNDDCAEVTDNDGDGHDSRTDCDDNNNMVHPAMAEVANDGIDQNCDGVDLIDVDLDGWSSTEDCNDGDASIYPGAPETEGDGIDQDCDGVDATPGVITLAEVGTGGLVITEIMRDPNAVGDTSGEWFEIYNATGADVDLNGLYVYDVNSSLTYQGGFQVTTALVIAAGDYMVFGVNGNTATNGGVTLDYTYTSSFQLANSSDEIYLGTNTTSYIDQVTWTSSGWPSTAGRSMNLNPGAQNATSNDTSSNWCTATTTYGSGDRGTPGAMNDAC